MINGTTRNSITWARCEECGDSKKSWKAHKLIDDKGSTYCFKCGHSSQLGIGELIELMLGDKTVEELLEERATAERNPAQLWSRGTMLDQYAITGEKDWVSYQMRDCNGNLTGWHNRNIKVKECDNEGRRGIGYIGSSLVSSPSQPLTVVEGPTDVLTSNHSCVFGTICASTMKHYRLQYTWLYPDPDQLDTAAKRSSFVRKTVFPAIDDGMVFVQGVIVGNGDPDVATVTKHIPLEQLYRWA